MCTSKLSSLLISALSVCALALGPAEAGSRGTPTNTQSQALRSRGTALGTWVQDAQGYGAASAELVHQGEQQASLLMLLNLQPGESHYAGTLAGKVVDLEGPDPHKQPGLLSVLGTWNRIDGKGGKFRAMMYLKGSGIMSVIPIGLIEGEYRLDEQALAADYSIQG